MPRQRPSTDKRWDLLRPKITTPCERDSTDPEKVKTETNVFHWNGRTIEDALIGHYAVRAGVKAIPPTVRDNVRQFNLETVKRELKSYYIDSGIADGESSSDALISSIERQATSVFSVKKK